MEVLYQSQKEAKIRSQNFFKGNGNVASTSTSTATTDDVARQEKADKPVDRVISIDPQSDDTLIVSDSSELELSF